MSQVILSLLVVLLLAYPLGSWIEKVMNQKLEWAAAADRKVLSWLHIPQTEMNWKKYLISLLCFSLCGFLVLFALLLIGGFSWDLALNTAVSYITNTNWQAFDPSLQTGMVTQVFGFLVQNFVSAACGICVLFALLRGFVRTKTSALGNFYTDMLNTLLFILIPFNLITGILLGAGGLPQNLNEYKTSALIEPVAADENGQIFENAVIEDGKVYVDGIEDQDAILITKQYVPSGLMASSEAIKQSGTNGGGLSAANSASPIENPNAFTNFVETVSILLIPASLCFSFGKMVQSRKQGMGIFAAMAIFFGLALACLIAAELAGGSLEGKEIRIGLENSALFAASTTAASSGSVNSAMNSLSPFGSMVCLVLMQIGEVIFGGVGSGLYGMIAFVIVTIFIAGLMVGRTPEFLGKKIEPFEMKWALVLCLAAPLCILITSGIGALVPVNTDGNQAHGFTQILYGFTSMGANNGSMMNGLSADSILVNVSGALSMLIGRFVGMAGALAMAGSLALKKKMAVSAGTLSTDNAQFVFLLLLVIVLVGALSFFPALSLGPLAEFFG